MSESESEYSPSWASDIECSSEEESEGHKNAMRDAYLRWLASRKPAASYGTLDTDVHDSPSSSSLSSSDSEDG